MDEARLELVRDWLTRASHDLGAARALAGLETLLDAAIYHCQQAAEKAVKGWLRVPVLETADSAPARSCELAFAAICGWLSTIRHWSRPSAICDWQSAIGW